MGVRMLGPVAIDDPVGSDSPDDGDRRDGDAHELAPRDRVVLATLVMSPRDVVSADRLADALWREEPPHTWMKVVQGSISRIRKALGADAIQTTRRGYVLNLPDEAIDGLRFEEQVRRGRELLRLREPDRARYTLTRALALWYGPALADLSGWAPGEAAAARWEELRREAEELRIEAALAAGGPREVLIEAGRLVADQPFRENRWALLASAQYQAGRQGEALATLKRARAFLAGELGLDPGPELEALEQSILHQDPDLFPSAEAGATSPRCPYPGLLTYDVDDAERYFGRDADIDNCLKILGREHVVVVVGASGSGKSSLARAGVAARLRSAGRTVAVITPGPHPMAALEEVGGLRAHAVLVVDQIEEVVTLCEDERERADFLDAVAGDSRAEVDLVLTLRADRLAALSGHHGFAQLVERGLHLQRGMSEDDLRSAVEGPARQAGLILEPGLVDLLVHEIAGEPGALPLLSHALAETWQRREGRTLTVEGYRASGGIQGAVARSAEQVFQGLDAQSQATARSLLLRLVVPAGSGEPSRSRVPRRLMAADARHEEIIEQLVSARLVTSDGDSVALAHESLARAWPRLRGWLDADTEGQLLLRHLATAADSWVAMGRPDSELYRGTRLARTLEWRTASTPELTPTETQFLDASEALALTEAKTSEQRLAEQARSNRRLRGLLLGVAGALVVAMVAGSLAVRESNRADAQADLATVRELAAASRAVRTEDPALAILLALEATAPELSGGDPPREAVEALHLAVAASRVTLTVQGAGGRVAWSPDGRHIATEGPENSGLVEVRDAENGDKVRSFEGHDADVNDVAFGPDGHLATTDNDGVLRVWGPESDDPLAEVTGKGAVWDPSFATEGPPRVAGVWPDEGVVRVATRIDDGSPDIVEHRMGGWIGDAELSPDGTWLAVATGESGGLILDARTGETRQTLAAPEPLLGPLAVSRDGRWVATVGGGGGVRIYNTATGRRVHTIEDVQGRALAWSGSGRLAVTHEQGEIRVYDVGRRHARLAHQLPFASRIGGLAFSPDGSRLLAGDIAVTAATVWDLGIAGDAEVAALRGAPDANGLGFGPDGRLYAAGEGVTVAAYDVAAGPDPEAVLSAPRELDDPRDGFQSLAVSADGQLVGIGGSPAGAWVWDIASEELVYPDTVPASDQGFQWLPAFSPDGEMMAVAGQDKVFLHRRDGSVEALLSPGAGFEFHRDPVFSPDGDTLALIQRPVRESFEGWAVVWWDWRSDEVRRTPIAPAARDLAYSPDGSRLVVALLSDLPTVIDVESGETAFRLGHTGGVLDVAFSPDGRRIVTGGLDGQVIVWDPEDGSMLDRLPPSEHEVSSVAFSPDGRHLATDSNATDIIRVWTLDVAELRQIATDRATRDFTPEECRQYLHRACDEA